MIPCNALWPHCTRGEVQVHSYQDGTVKLSVSAGPGNYANVVVKEKDWRRLVSCEDKPAEMKDAHIYVVSSS